MQDPIPLYRAIASEVSRLDSPTWGANAKEAIETLTRDFLPSGSGFNNGTKFDFDRSKRSKLVFHTSFHHMDENGYYDGWTDHTVTITPSFDGIEVKVSGRNRNDIKDYIADEFALLLEDVKVRFSLLESEARWTVAKDEDPHA